MDKEKDTKRIVAIILVLIVILAIFIGIRSCSKPEEEIEPTPTPEVTPEPTPTPTPTPKPSTNNQPTTQNNPSTESTEEVEATPVVNEVVVKPAEEEPSYSMDDLEALYLEADDLSKTLGGSKELKFIEQFEALANDLATANERARDLLYGEGLVSQEDINSAYDEIKSLMDAINQKINELEKIAQEAMKEAERRKSVENVTAVKDALAALPESDEVKTELTTSLAEKNLEDEAKKNAFVDSYETLVAVLTNKEEKYNDVTTIYLDQDIVIDETLIESLSDELQSEQFKLDFTGKTVKVDMSALPSDSKLDAAPAIKIENVTYEHGVLIEELAIETAETEGTRLVVYNSTGVAIKNPSVIGPESVSGEEVVNTLIGIDVNGSTVTLKGKVAFKNVGTGVKVHKDPVGEVALAQDAKLTIGSQASITNETETKEQATIVLENKQEPDNKNAVNDKSGKLHSTEPTGEDVVTTYYYVDEKLATVGLQGSRVGSAELNFEPSVTILSLEEENQMNLVVTLPVPETTEETNLIAEDLETEVDDVEEELPLDEEETEDNLGDTEELEEEEEQQDETLESETVDGELEEEVLATEE